MLFLCIMAVHLHRLTPIKELSSLIELLLTTYSLTPVVILSGAALELRQQLLVIMLNLTISSTILPQDIAQLVMPSLVLLQGINDRRMWATPPVEFVQAMKVWLKQVKSVCTFIILILRISLRKIWLMTSYQIWSHVLVTVNRRIKIQDFNVRLTKRTAIHKSCHVGLLLMPNNILLCNSVATTSQTGQRKSYVKIL